MANALSRLAIGFDVDDVIVPWMRPAHHLCVEAGLCDVGDWPQTYHPWTDYGCEYEDWLKVIGEGIRLGTLYRENPYPGVVEAMNKLWRHDRPNDLRYGVRVPLVTARATGDWPWAEECKQHTYAQLERCGVPYSWLTFTRDKTSVRSDYFIDDSLRNYDELDAAGVRVFLQNRPWNEIPEGDDRRRVDSVAEYVDIVLEEASAE